MVSAARLAEGAVGDVDSIARYIDQARWNDMNEIGGSCINDKAGAQLILLRWVSMRTIKETFIIAVDYRYPFLEKD